MSVFVTVFGRFSYTKTGRNLHKTGSFFILSDLAGTSLEPAETVANPAGFWKPLKNRTVFPTGYAIARYPAPLSSALLPYCVYILWLCIVSSCVQLYSNLFHSLALFFVPVFFCILLLFILVTENFCFFLGSDLVKKVLKFMVCNARDNSRKPKDGSTSQKNHCVIVIESYRLHNKISIFLPSTRTSCRSNIIYELHKPESTFWSGEVFI